MELLILNIGTQPIVSFIPLLIILPVFILQLSCLINVAISKKITVDQRKVWVLVILFVPVIGSIAYLVMGKNKGTTIESK